MRNLYSRFILFLIRPALELRKPKVDPQHVIDIMLKDLRKNGPYSRAAKVTVSLANQATGSRSTNQPSQI